MKSPVDSFLKKLLSQHIPACYELRDWLTSLFFSVANVSLCCFIIQRVLYTIFYTLKSFHRGYTGFNGEKI